MTERQCKQCKDTFPLDHVHFKTTTINGKIYYRHICRPCLRLYNKRWEEIYPHKREGYVEKRKAKEGRLKPQEPKSYDRPIDPYFPQTQPLPGWLMGLQT